MKTNCIVKTKSIPQKNFKNFCNRKWRKCTAIAAWKPRQKYGVSRFEFYASKTRYQNVHGSTFWVLDKENAVHIIQLPVAIEDFSQNYDSSQSIQPVLSADEINFPI